MEFLSLFFCDFLTLSAIQRVYREGVFIPFLKNVSALWSVRFTSVRFIETYKSLTRKTFRSEVYCPSYRDVHFMVCPSYRDSTVVHSTIFFILHTCF